MIGVVKTLFLYYGLPHLTKDIQIWPAGCPKFAAHRLLALLSKNSIIKRGMASEPYAPMATLVPKLSFGTRVAIIAGDGVEPLGGRPVKASTPYAPDATVGSITEGTVLFVH